MSESYNEKVKVAIIARLKNGILYEAAQKLGSQSALARHLGLSPAEVGAWINFQRSPLTIESNSKRPPEFWQEIENKLFELTGHTLEEIFPPEIRTKAFLERQKKIEAIVEMPMEQLIAAGAVPRLLLPAPDEILYQEDIRTAIDEALGNLKPRTADILKMRFGLAPYDSEHTLEEVAKKHKVISERVRQIEAGGLRRLRAKTKPNRTLNRLALTPHLAGPHAGSSYPEPHKFPEEGKQ